MDSKLKLHYKTFRYFDEDTIEDGYHIFSYEGQLFGIHQDELVGHELMLLNTLLPRQDFSLWQRYFMSDAADVPKQGKFRLIQIRFEHDHEDIPFWIETFLSFFDAYEDCFELQNRHHVLILKAQDFVDEDLNGIVQTMYEDIGLKASLYIGELIDSDKNLKKQLSEDQQIFISSKTHASVNTYKDLYLEYYMSDIVERSYQMKQLRELIEGIKGAHEIITTLWIYQGNITQASQALYLHRNTLNYRLDKFEELSGLSLRSLADLQLCYFSII